MAEGDEDDAMTKPTGASVRTEFQPVAAEVAPLTGDAWLTGASPSHLFAVISYCADRMT